MERTLSLNEAFKRQAVEMVLRGGKTVKQAALLSPGREERLELSPTVWS